MAPAPIVAHSSPKPIKVRTNAWRNVIGPPSSRTMRVPTMKRPSDFPRVRVSTVIGTRNSHSAVTIETNAATCASLEKYMKSSLSPLRLSIRNSTS